MLITIDDAVTRLAGGDVVALPSETVYGLAGLALNEQAIAKIYALKGRPATNPLIVHVAHLQQAEELCYVNSQAKRVGEAYWPGPITLVLPKKKSVPGLVTAGNQTVAIRIPRHPVFLEVLTRLNQPLAAPSANPSNRTSPTEARHVEELFGKKCPPTVDGGKCAVGLESTVLDLSGDQPTILRPGLITRAQIQDCLQRQVGLFQDPSPDPPAKEGQTGRNQGAPSPGMGSVHYAPRTPLALYPTVEEFLISAKFKPGDLVIVADGKDATQLDAKGYLTTPLSTDGCPEEVAQNLYGVLIELDAKNAPSMHLIFTGAREGINRAIWDRLYRAETK